MHLSLYNRLFSGLLSTCLQETNLTFFITVRSGIALGVLTQPKGNSQQPIVYLRKELNSVAQGWPHGLQTVSSVALFIPEMTKLIID